MIKDYYRLTKPRMVYMNVLVAAAAFIFASHQTIDWQSFALLLAGLSCIVGSACVFNNYADRSMDARMERTKKRPLVAGSITSRQALFFGFMLLVAGVLLMLFLPPLALVSALLGFAVYVLIYTPLKPRTPYALYPGAVAGAMPPVVGYAAAAGTLDLFALAFFLLLFLWQIPHFLAIARFRYEEYTAAGVPLLVGRPRSEAERRAARTAFHLSLFFLLAVCLVWILQR